MYTRRGEIFVVVEEAGCNLVVKNKQNRNIVTALQNCVRSSEAMHDGCTHLAVLCGCNSDAAGSRGKPRRNC
jgi:hypothetical protein